MQDHSQPLFTVSVVSSLVGVSPQTLRNWEARGLVAPLREGRTRRRLYTWPEIERLQRIRYLSSRRRVPLRKIKVSLLLPQVHRILSVDPRPRRGGISIPFMPPLAAVLPIR